MINGNMRLYDFSTIGTKDKYGQQLADYTVKGQVKMSINLTSQMTQDNINYKDANYMGLTMDNVEDTYIIHFNNEKLKVLYINPFGRFKQVYLKKI